VLEVQNITIHNQSISTRIKIIEHKPGIQKILPSIPWLRRTALRPRSRQIVSVLTRHGLGWMVNKLGERMLPQPFQSSSKTMSHQKQAEQVRKALEELGPTFIKLGQALSSRPDILPVEYVQEFNKLQDEVPPAPFAEIKEILYAEFGRPLEEVFTSFNPEPIASASIGQVYAAVLPSGQPVVVKVRRPGVEKLIEQDIQILADMAEWLTAHSDLGKSYDLVSLLDEFAFRIHHELDYQREGHNADIFRRQFHGDACIHIPKVYWKFTTSCVITLERVYGIKINDLMGLERANIRLKLVAENSAHFTLRQLFEFGFFHADPHPGNFYVQPDGSLAVMDFGMVGRFSPNMKNALIRLVLSISRGDAEGVVDVMTETGMTNAHIRRPAMEQDVARFIESYSGNDLQFVTTTKIFNQFMEIAFRYGIQLPSELTMLGRLITINEGISQMLYPGFRMLDYAAPFVRDFWKDERSPEKMLPRMAKASIEGLEFSLELPRLASRLLKQIDRGQLELNINYDFLREFTAQMQKMTNRLALSVLLAATIVALGMVMVVYHPTTWQKLGEFVFGLAFISSLAFGAWLMISIWRSGK
jgi:ubiquinone biosynthesis protein